MMTKSSHVLDNHTGFDVIGDIHGHASALENLLAEMGLQNIIVKWVWYGIVEPLYSGIRQVVSQRKSVSDSRLAGRHVRPPCLITGQRDRI